MKMSGEEIIPAPRAVVWKALNDPHVLKQCIPGCQSITKHSDTKMDAKVQVKVGPMKANFAGSVTLSHLNPPESYHIAGHGSGGFAGSAQGGANVRLEVVPEGTKLSYDVDSRVGGKLASLGARFIDPMARNLVGKFFEKFAEIAGAMAGDAPVIEEAAEAAPAAEAAAPAKKPAAKKAPARKPAAKKPAAKKLAAKKPAAKAPAKKPAAKKAAKAPAKKAAKKKR
jgi:uncharacterized protein